MAFNRALCNGTTQTHAKAYPSVRQLLVLKESGTLVFEELGTPSHTEVLDVARRTAERIDRLLRKSGRSGERAGLPQLRLFFGTAPAPPPAPERAEHNADEPVAEHRGINIHAKQSVDAALAFVLLSQSLGSGGRVFRSTGSSPGVHRW